MYLSAYHRDKVSTRSGNRRTLQRHDALKRVRTNTHFSMASLAEDRVAASAHLSSVDSRPEDHQLVDSSVSVAIHAFRFH